ncbi:hypothetical protein BZG36_01953 [Bifiguratus adelaidae]|uniref:Methyltransferase domain-containing protein n=1 Tax=Bifiguratus adelaidae TaxID=1938954 RepID=A0A261Y3T4_9FUNG|nr:hypothetical protein BZG36_01953 [Bifiguratus adelaidae]
MGNTIPKALVKQRKLSRKNITSNKLTSQSSLPSTSPEQPPRSSRTSSKDSTLSTVTSNPTADKPQFIWDNGRRFHNVASVAYVLPNDDAEVDRLNFQHYLIKWALDGNYQTPNETELKNGINVLDIGCGPGVWTLEMAHAFPNSDFHGIDISPVFPEAIRPANTHFQIGNAAEGLPFPDNYFDFVFQRLLLASYTLDNWKFVLKEIERVLKPSGWMEIVEINMAPGSSGPIYTEYLLAVNNGLKERGLDPYVATHLVDLVKNNVHVDPATIRTDYASLPWNWGGKMGDIGAYNVRHFFESLQPWQTKARGISDEEYAKNVSAIIEECGEHKAYNNIHFVVAQLPGPAEATPQQQIEINDG